MRVKCRGYEGNLIYLYADEYAVTQCCTDETFYGISHYSIVIRSDDRAKIELQHVEESEIEVIHG